ncbi:MAG: phytanoyl-CoA dioxygenase family protein [Armatimonadetes bacterium]|nr:phytanoyl-CoA dioxygenase family protein [Armatimonadota bacterium]
MLTQTQIAQFFDEGYVMVPGLFAPAELEPLRQEIAGLVDDTAQRLAADGKIADTHADEPFETRLTRLLADHPETQGEFMRAIEGKAGGGHTGEEMFRLIVHPRLLDAMADLVGPEIVASSVYRIRPKVPGLGRGVVPWHQDSGYFEAHCDKSLIVTCWIPLVDATLENGCLHVLPRAHRQGVAPHHTGGNAGFLVIEDPDLPRPLPEAVPVPVPLGGALLLTNLAPHCSTPNTTDTIRWSVDLRYQGADVPTNAFQEPAEFRTDAPPVEIACYPPEGDFVVRSAAHPERVHSYAQFVQRRTRYESASLPGPNRGWQPMGA